eukprot:3796415-Alexandrium_andersonii.AAC.1
MSASLVGSEMCIRDRSQCRAPSRVARGEADGAHGQISNYANQGFAQLGPVSYTHLTLPTICSV